MIDYTPTRTTTLNGNHTHLHLHDTPAVLPSVSLTEPSADPDHSTTSRPLVYRTLPPTTGEPVFFAYSPFSPKSLHTSNPCLYPQPVSDPVSPDDTLLTTTIIHNLINDHTTTLSHALIAPTTSSDCSGTHANIPNALFQRHQPAEPFTNMFEFRIAFEQDLQRAQKEFDENMKKHEKFFAQLRSTRTYNSAHNQPEPPTQSSPCSPITQPLTDQPANTVAAIHSYPSPLNTRFLLPTGDYDSAANGVLWYTASLFSILPFMQTIPRPTTTELRADCTVYRVQSVWPINNRTISDLTDGYTTLISSKTFVYDYIAMARPLDNATVDTYCPPWPPPHLLRGLPTLRQFADFRSDIFWPNRIPPHDSWGSLAFRHYYVNLQPRYFRPTNPDQSGYLCLSIRPMRPVPQTSYRFFFHVQLRSPLQYRILYSRCVSTPTSLTEDKNLLRPP